uniref:Ion transport domain-containing protein n=1 Tax=Tetradesmus obliquus TaxID=3088 RepID=A0A383WLL7_TETOB|eukprot:jgi/Sobl393_1/11893/SZX78059.1
MSQQPFLSAASDANSDASSEPGSGSRRSVAWQHNPFSQFKTKLSQPRASLRPSRQGSYDSLSALEAQSAASISTTPSGSRRPGAAHSQAHGFNARAVAKFQQLSATYRSRRQLQEQEDVELPPWVVHPYDIAAQCWWTFILVTVVATLFLEPFNLAWSEYPGLYPLSSWDTLFAIAYFYVYASDVLLNFCVAYHAEDGELVTDLPSIARHYAASGRLWADLATTIPFDWIVLEVMGLQESNSTLAWYISLLRLLRLGRAYRLYGWVQNLTYNQTLSLLAVTLARNFALCFFTVHWGACGFWYIARQGGFSPQTWVGANMDWVETGRSSLDKWVYSMYWSIITFSTVGYGDLHAYSVPEAAYVVVFMFVSLGVAAYFVGTSVLLVVENEKRTGSYRESLIVLDEYSATHSIPPALKADMKGHLRLHFSTADFRDEAVLGVFPTMLRRRALRHLYNAPLHACWLFGGAKQKFLDALLLGARVELFGPKYVRTTGLCRVLVIPRSVYNALAADYPMSARAVMDNLQERAEQLILREFPGPSAARIMEQLDALAALELTWANPEQGPAAAGAAGVASSTATSAVPSRQSSFTGGLPTPGWLTPPAPGAAAAAAASASAPPPAAAGGLPVEPLTGLPLRTGQQQVLSNLLRVRALVKATAAKQEQGRTAAFLAACSVGNLDRMRLMLQQGCDVNCCDYDGRTGLMLAASKGLAPAVKQLLVAGAAVDALDHGGSSALLEACSGGHDEVIELLLWAGGHLNVSGVKSAALLCAAVYEGDMQLLRRLLRAGARADAEDYDKRTALHIAASDGNMPAVKLLVEEGGADPSLVDRWEQSPLDEARRVGAAPVVEYLAGCVTEAAAADAVVKFQLWQAQAMLNAASRGRLASVQQLLDRGCPADVCDYDKRTGLMLAAANGHEAVVSLLLSAGANPNARDNLGGSALLEAVRGGRERLVGCLVGAGGCLQLAGSELASALCSMVVDPAGRDDARYMAAGANVAAGDYNGQTALHIAAVHGKLDMVKLLVEEGGADLAAQDRWGATPLDEAQRVGAADVAAYLSSSKAAQAAAAARTALAARQGSSSRFGPQPQQ